MAQSPPRQATLAALLLSQYVQKKSPMYSHVKEETVWQMDRFNSYVNERFRHTRGLPKDWVFTAFTVSLQVCLRDAANSSLGTLAKAALQVCF